MRRNVVAMEVREAEYQQLTGIKGIRKLRGPYNDLYPDWSGTG